MIYAPQFGRITGNSPEKSVIGNGTDKTRMSGGSIPPRAQRYGDTKKRIYLRSNGLLRVRLIKYPHKKRKRNTRKISIK